MSVKDREQCISKKRLSFKSQNFGIEALLGNRINEKYDGFLPLKIDETKCHSETLKEDSDKSPSHFNKLPKTQEGSSANVFNELNESAVVELYRKELWNQFYYVGNEMIVNKTGRRMFPPLKISVLGLDGNSFYNVWIEITPTDNYRYRYHYTTSKWIKAGVGEPPASGSNKYVHPESPASGSHWMSQTISFDKLKLTNCKDGGASSQVAVHSMHKYKPRIHIQLVRPKGADRETPRSLQFAFPQTEFITVTAYQNPKIIRLKVNHNPFAKGFREVSRKRDISSLITTYRPLLCSIQESCLCCNSFRKRVHVPCTLSPNPYDLSLLRDRFVSCPVRLCHYPTCSCFYKLFHSPYNPYHRPK